MARTATLTPEDQSRTAIRCAIYTRKSTEEGLEQEYNSLDAQYDACSAYVASQRHEGWTLGRDRYDDGGFSGGNMERPGLKRLLSDVAAGRINVIVLYKIDRLTRSLSDFARIVEVLDKAGASFVSVTQSFNTTTSMGRLMLNVLLSFAQFERELTGERIRDKFAASKAKGLWMGGPVPLGYRVQDRKLLIEPAEAETVRHIFKRYTELGSGQELVEELREQGYRTARRERKDGRVRGGVPFERGSLFHLLSNRIYCGLMVHKGHAHPGEHEAIIEPGLWDQVQARIAENRVTRRSGRNVQQPSVLAGRIFDGLERPMTPSHAVRSGKRYRYYITRTTGIANEHPAWRLPAHDIERAVIARLVTFLDDRSTIRKTLVSVDAAVLSRSIDLGKTLADRLRNSPSHRRTQFAALVERVDVLEGRVRISLDRAGLASALECDVGATEPLQIELSVSRVRKGSEVKLVLGNDIGTRPDPGLVSLLEEARSVREQLLASPGQTISGMAVATGRCRKRLSRLVALSWLAPEVVERIIEGKQPEALTSAGLLDANLPCSWPAQAEHFGIA